MRTTASRVLAHWVTVGLSTERPHSPDSIARELEKAGLVVGRDYVDFLTTVGGMEDHDMRLDLWSVWRLERVLAENPKTRKEHVYFADWCIHSHLHFLRKENAHTSSVWVDHFDDESPRMVAGSLDDFFIRYLARDSTIGVYFDEEKGAIQPPQPTAASRRG